MNILVLNSGSSSLKFQLIDVKNEIALIKGHIDGIGLEICKLTVNDKEEKRKIKNHTDAIKIVLSKIPIEKIDIIGHRVVHGGEFYSKATLIDDVVINKIQELCQLAPLHNPSNLEGIKACIKAMPNIKQIAIFDTAYHQTIPKYAFLYAIPYEYYEKYKIRRYGFHGTSHQYIALETAKILKKKQINIISCHLGNGSSITAIKNSKSIDTSMGFTPIEGLLMGTRCGDIDCGIIEFISNKENLTLDEIFNILNKKSGLLGLCNDSDMRIIHEKYIKGDKKAVITIDILAYKIAKYISSYFGILGKVDAIIFTAGIGEKAHYLREKVCTILQDSLKISLDIDKNKENAIEISNSKSKIKVLVIPTNEELMIAKESYELLNRGIRKTPNFMR